MSAVFLTILNMSIKAGWLILAVVAVRFLLKKAPRWITCLLWGLVAIRLVCPFSFETVLSLIPSGETIPANIAMQQEPVIHSGITIVDETINPVIAESFRPDPAASVNPLQIIISIVVRVWIAGIVALIIYALVSYLKLRKTVSVCVPVGEKIFACDEVKTPFILGIFRPRIYVPSGISEETLDYVLRHENAHLKRHDHWWKPLAFLLLAVYWFNPLCWAAYILLCRDIETACDEKVIRDMDKDGKAGYSQALLDCSFQRKKIAACPLAFGEVGVKERVKGILNYKKPAFWIILISVIACAALAVFLMTDPSSGSHTGKNEETETESSETSTADTEVSTSAEEENATQNNTAQENTAQENTVQGASGETKKNALKRAQDPENWKTPGVYPVNPSSEIWAELSYQEAIDVTNMPEELLKELDSMPIEELGLWFMNYPFLSDSFAFDDFSVGLAKIASRSRIVKAFRHRDEAGAFLLKYYEQLIEGQGTEGADGNKTEIQKLFIEAYFYSFRDAFSPEEQERMDQLLKNKVPEPVGEPSTGYPSGEIQTECFFMDGQVYVYGGSAFEIKAKEGFTMPKLGEIRKENNREIPDKEWESCHIPVGTAVIRWEGSVYIEQSKGGQYMYYRPARESELEWMTAE